MSKESTDETRSNSNHQTMMTPERLKAMQESLRVAAQIRQELEGRTHSDSTGLGTEDRQR